MTTQQTVFPIKVGYKADQYDLGMIGGKLLPDTSGQITQDYQRKLDSQKMQHALDNTIREFEDYNQKTALAYSTPEETFLSKLAPYAPTINKLIGEVKQRREEARKKEAEEVASIHLNNALYSGGALQDMQNQGEIAQQLADKASADGKSFNVVKQLSDLDPRQQHYAAAYLTKNAADMHDHALKSYASSNELIEVPDGKGGLKRIAISQANTREEYAAVVQSFNTQFEETSGIAQLPLELRQNYRRQVADNNQKFLSARYKRADIDAGIAARRTALKAVIGGASVVDAVRIYARTMNTEGKVLGLAGAWEQFSKDMYKLASEGNLTWEQFEAMRTAPGIQNPNRFIDDPKEKGWVFNHIAKGMRAYDKEMTQVKKERDKGKAEILVDEVRKTYEYGQQVNVPSEKTIAEVDAQLRQLGVHNHPWVKYWTNGRSQDDVLINNQVDQLKFNARHNIPSKPEHFHPDAWEKAGAPFTGPNGINAVKVNPLAKEQVTALGAWAKGGSEPGREGMGLGFSLEKGKSESLFLMEKQLEKHYHHVLKQLNLQNPDNPENFTRAREIVKEEALSGITNRESVYYYDPKSNSQKFPNLTALAGANGDLSFKSKFVGPQLNEYSRFNKKVQDLKLMAAKAPNGYDVYFDDGVWQTWTSEAEIKRLEQVLSAGGRVTEGGFLLIGHITKQPAILVFNYLAQKTGLAQPVTSVNADFPVDRGLMERVENITRTGKQRLRSSGYYNGDPNQIPVSMQLYPGDQ